jgi:uncharacterized protein (TIGR00725 family)
VIAVIGPGDTADTELLAIAEEVGRLLAAAGEQVVTGGLGGVMAAAARGAQAAGGTAVALLPGDDPDDANSDSTVVIATGLGQGRNLLVVRSARAVIAVGGSWGTLAEVGLARRIGRPVVWVRGWQIDGPADPVPTADTAQAAVAAVL